MEFNLSKYLHFMNTACTIKHISNYLIQKDWSLMHSMFEKLRVIFDGHITWKNHIHMQYLCQGQCCFKLLLKEISTTVQAILNPTITQLLLDEFWKMHLQYGCPTFKWYLCHRKGVMFCNTIHIKWLLLEKQCYCNA